MGTGTSFDWRALRDRVAALRVTRCRLAHERVRRENGRALRVHRGEAEAAPVRVGLCDPEERAGQLACGHTMARYALLEALASLHAAGELSEAAHVELDGRLRRVSDAIHLLDHEKGEAEKRRAFLPEGSGESAAAAAEVRALERRHDGYAEEVREVHAAVLRRLDALVPPGRTDAA